MTASLAVDSPPPAATAPPYFSVATHKFVAMSICTFGIYELYWFYQTWKTMRDATGEKLSPFASRRSRRKASTDVRIFAPPRTAGTGGRRTGWNDQKALSSGVIDRRSAPAAGSP